MKSNNTDTIEVGGRMPHINLVTHYVRRPDRVAIDMRHFGLPDCVVLGRMTYRHAYPGLPLHRHDGTAELVFSKSGSQPYRIGRQTFTMIAGEARIIPPDSDHSNNGHPTYPGVRYWMQFILPRPRAATWLGLPRTAYKPFTDWLRHPPDRAIRYPAGIPDRFDRIIALTRLTPAHPRATPLELVRIRTEVLSILLDLYDLSQSDEKEEADRGRVARWIRWAETQPRLPALSAFARRFRISKPVIVRLFREATGLPPHLYFLHRRVERAQSLILGGEKSVTAIAQQCGFCSSQYFATQFKKISGASPRSFLHFIERQKTSRQDGQT